MLNKSCPKCKSNSSFHFFRNREEIIQCPNCKVLLAEDSTSKLISGVVFFVGGFIATGSKWIGIPIWLALFVMILCIYVALKIIRFRIIKRDLKIRNKQTNQISFVNNSEWNEIIENTADKENSFEVLEYLNP